MTATAMTDRELSPQARTKDRFVKMREVLDRLGISRSTLYDMMENGEFPEPIVLRNKLHCWLESDIEEYMSRKIAQRRKPFRATHDAR